MKIYFLIIFLLNACVNSRNYVYHNTHKLDNKIDNNVCFYFDNSETSYFKGHKNLIHNPFNGEENYDFSTDDIKTTKRDYIDTYKNKKCSLDKKEIKLIKSIEIKSITYPAEKHYSAFAGQSCSSGIGCINMYNTIPYMTTETLYRYHITFSMFNKDTGKIDTIATIAERFFELSNKNIHNLTNKLLKIIYHKE